MAKLEIRLLASAKLIFKLSFMMKVIDILIKSTSSLYMRERRLKWKPISHVQATILEAKRLIHPIYFCSTGYNLIKKLYTDLLARVLVKNLY